MISQAQNRRRSARTAYQELKRQLLQRDNWRCQACGSRTALEVHHLKFRSHQGEDTEQNLITLCTSCHRQIHAGTEIIFGSEKSR
jgi:5-methylcytosine-specific restriction endonuclease McrA